jgi:hypothetical protein
MYGIGPGSEIELLRAYNYKIIANDLGLAISPIGTRYSHENDNDVPVSALSMSKPVSPVFVFQT